MYCIQYTIIYFHQFHFSIIKYSNFSCWCFWWRSLLFLDNSVNRKNERERKKSFVFTLSIVYTLSLYTIQYTYTESWTWMNITELIVKLVWHDTCQCAKISHAKFLLSQTNWNCLHSISKRAQTAQPKNSVCGQFGHAMHYCAISICLGATKILYGKRVHTDRHRVIQALVE